jgi:hypothetical protein
MFPELARIWHDEVASRMIRLVASAVERAQAKGTVRAGDSNLMAFSIMAPIVMGVLFHELFGTSRCMHLRWTNLRPSMLQ